MKDALLAIVAEVSEKADVQIKSKLQRAVKPLRRRETDCRENWKRYGSRKRENTRLERRVKRRGWLLVPECADCRKRKEKSYYGTENGKAKRMTKTKPGYPGAWVNCIILMHMLLCLLCYSRGFLKRLCLRIIPYFLFV